MKSTSETQSNVDLKDISIYELIQFTKFQAIINQNDGEFLTSENFSIDFVMTHLYWRRLSNWWMWPNVWTWFSENDDFDPFSLVSSTSIELSDDEDSLMHSVSDIFEAIVLNRSVSFDWLFSD